MKRTFYEAFIRNTRRARVKSGWTDMKEFAELMGVPYAAYAKYETRTPLPHHLIPKFCKITNTPMGVLFDSGQKPKAKEHPIQGFLRSVKK